MNKRKICKNCSLFNSETKTCGVTIINEGQYWELPVKETDRCHWLKIEDELNLIDNEETSLVNSLNIKYDLDNKKIKIESPE